MADDVSLTRLETGMIALRGSVDEFRAEQDRRWTKIEPVIMARSGELERMRNFERDLNHLGEKHRKIETHISDVETRFAAAISRVEKRQERAGWIVIGAFAVLQFLWMLAQPWIDQLAGR